MFSACAAQAKLLEKVREEALAREEALPEPPIPGQAFAKDSATAGGPGPKAIPKNVKSRAYRPGTDDVRPSQRALSRDLYQDCSCLPNLSRRYLNVHECASNDSTILQTNWAQWPIAG